MNQLLIYTPRLTSRLEYVFSFVFSSILGLSFKITSSKEVFYNSELPVLSYAPHPVDKGIWIQSQNLLFETGIRSQDIKTGIWNKLPVIFYTGPGPDLPFDLFASVFYLISRYEEYLDFPRDNFLRFPSTSSLAFKEQFLELPIVDIWVRLLGRVLKVRFPEIKIKPPEYSFISTIDVDQAWAYKHKGIMRQIFGSLASILKGRPSEIFKRFSVASGRTDDPFETYSYVLDVHKALKPIFFFQVGKYGAYDKNIRGTHPAMRKLIRHIASQTICGLHPSVRSRERKELDQELVLLTDILGSKVKLSRQHYLKLSFPDTFRDLSGFGIEADYSLGYHDAIGFRASTSYPFHFFNLATEQESPLQIVPFQVMDVSLKNQLGLSPEQAIERISEMIGQVRKTGGNFVSIWHNSSLNDQEEWNGWRAVFEDMLNKAGN